MVHSTLEEHVKEFCSNCKKPRDEEAMTSVWEGSFHYVHWECVECNEETWFKTEFMSSGIHHFLL